MKDAFKKLKELQKVLLKEFGFEKELKQIPRELNESTRKLQKVDRNIKEKQSDKENHEKKIQDLRREKEVLKQNKEKYEEQISLIKTQREYEAITNEIAQINEKLESIEEQELNSYEEIERLNKIVEDQEGLHEELSALVKEKQKEVNVLMRNKQKEFNKCIKEKDKIASGLDEETIYKFEKIVRKKDGLGIVSVINNVCMGCNMILPPQFVNDVRREDKIIFCPNCSRILYYEEKSREATEEVVLQGGIGVPE